MVDSWMMTFMLGHMYWAQSSPLAFEGLLEVSATMMCSPQVERTVTPRMEANALTAFCIRSNIEDEHAGSADRTLRAALADVADQASNSLVRLLAFRDVERGNATHDRFWKKFVIGYHAGYCGYWETKPATSPARLICRDSSHVQNNAGPRHRILADVSQVLSALEGQTCTVDCTIHDRDLSDYTPKQEANVLIYLAFAAAPAFQQTAQESEQGRGFLNQTMRLLMIQTSERLMHLIQIRDQLNFGDEWTSFVLDAHQQWCAGWSTVYGRNLNLMKTLSELNR